MAAGASVGQSTTVSTAAVGNRWMVAVAGVVMQLALGAVYGWSVFQKPLIKEFHWLLPEVTLTFTITIFVLGFAAFAGGLWMRKVGPRTVGLTAGALYGLGVFLAGYASNGLWELYLSYGVISGIGIGLGYIVPVATLVKWFPDKRGFITGVAVAGFGAGALITAPLATTLIQNVGVLSTFSILGVIYFILVVGAALFMRNPPEGYRPAGWTPTAAQTAQRAARDLTLGEALHKWQWYALWSLLFLNVIAGISIISQAASMAQEITKVDALTAAGFVGIIAIANASGRFLWAWLSDFIGRKWVFLVMFLLQAVLFFLLPLTSTFAIFTILAFTVVLCYGGGFGTMPAFATDYFGAKNVGPIYGLMLTAWGMGAVVGPLLIANIKQSTGQYSSALYIIAAIMLVSAILPFIVRPPSATAPEGDTADVVRSASLTR
ncbi:MAG: OFA family MFS transporter [Chloroflexota bacterium]|nr:OFA family MFS transporter [Chloroflexota bacterium]